MNSVPYVDELIREYLVFRGFTNTLNTFEADNKADKDRAFQSDKVSQHLLDLAATLEIESVLSYWRYLDLRLFSRLEEQYSPSVRHIEQELVRYCMIEGIARKKMGKVLACIEIYSSEMMHSAEWTRWFALPYLPEPEKTPYFRPYFSTQWQEAFRTSLRNFIDTVFKNMPLPGLLNFGADFINRQNLQAEIRNLKANIRTLHNKLEKSSIESKAIQQRLEATVQEQDSLRRSASAKSQDRPTSIHLPRGAADNAGEGGERALQPSSLPSGGQPSNHSAEPEIMMAVRDATADLADIRSIQSVSSNATAEDIPYAVVSQEIYQEHTAEVVSARFSTDGNLIASFDTDGIVKIWSHMQALTKANSKLNSIADVTCVEWDQKSSKLLFIGTSGGSIKVYNTESKAVVHDFICPSRHPYVTHLCCTPNAAVLVSVSSNIHTGGSRSPVQTFPSIGLPETGGVDPAVPRTEQLISTWDWKTRTNQNNYKLDTDAQGICSVRFNHNGQLLVVAEVSGRIHILDASTLTSIAQWQVEDQQLCLAVFSFDENEIICINTDNQVSTWSLHKPGTCTSPLVPTTRAPEMGGQSLTPHTVAVSDDAQHSVALLGPCQAAVYMMKSGKLLQNLKRHSQPITSVDWAADQNVLLTAGEDGLIRVYQLSKVLP